MMTVTLHNGELVVGMVACLALGAVLSWFLLATRMDVKRADVTLEVDAAYAAGLRRGRSEGRTGDWEKRTNRSDGTYLSNAQAVTLMSYALDRGDGVDLADGRRAL
jgi:hypothetical protein